MKWPQDMAVPPLPVPWFLLASGAWLCVSHEWAVFVCELLHVRLVQLRSASEHSCSYVYMYVFVYTHTCMYVLLFHTMQTHVYLLLIERGLFPRLVEAGGKLRTQVWLFPPNFHQVKEGWESGHLRWMSFTAFPVCVSLQHHSVSICVLLVLWGTAVGVLYLLDPKSQLQCFIWPGRCICVAFGRVMSH